jgi:hypothetical protein
MINIQPEILPDIAWKASKAECLMVKKMSPEIFVFVKWMVGKGQS